MIPRGLELKPDRGGIDKASLLGFFAGRVMKILAGRFRFGKVTRWNWRELPQSGPICIEAFGIRVDLVGGDQAIMAFLHDESVAVFQGEFEQCDHLVVEELG